MLFRRVCATALLALVSVTPTLLGGVLEDRGIEDAITRSFVFRELLIDRTMVRSYIRYGIVELRGQVADERERDLLTYFIAGLPEVKRVENLLFVDSDTRRSSARWNALRLRSQLLMLARADARQTRVEVIGEHWQLAGEFADESARAAFASCAQEISPGVPLALTLRAAGTTAPTLAKLDDASIAAIVRSVLETASITLTDPAITCAGGKVTLRGFARSQGEIELASRLASTTRGVTAVESHLAIQR